MLFSSTEEREILNINDEVLDQNVQCGAFARSVLFYFIKGLLRKYLS